MSKNSYIFSKLVLIMLNKCVKEKKQFSWTRGLKELPEAFHVTFKSSNLGLTWVDKKQKKNNSSITMSVAVEAFSAKALTLHFLQAKMVETKHGLLLITLLYTQQRDDKQQISTMCPQRINFHCQQLVISESQEDSQIINSTLMSHFMTQWSHAEPIKSLITLPSQHRGWKLKP